MNILKIAAALFVPVALSGCLAGNGFNLQGGTASRAANNQADQNLYRPVSYSNANRRGPTVVVLPGKIKSNNVTFKQQVSANNIADFAELELGNANFGVLERSDLGPLMNELNLAVTMGDPSALRKFRRGKFKSTNLLGNSRSADIANTVGSSVQTADSSGVWVVGMRYKILSAETTEQIATGYFEEKMEVGAKSVSVLGVSQAQTGGTTLDTIVQRLVQKAVQDIDRRGK